MRLRARFRPDVRSFRNAYRIFFLGTLIFAPWAYGATTAAAIVALNYLLGTVVLLWIADLAISRRMPRVPPVVLVLAGAVLALGWAMTCNAGAVYDPSFAVFVPVQRMIPALPGSVDAVNSLAMMLRCTLLLGVICFVADLVWRSSWLMRLWQTIALAGGSIALLGLLQKASGARMVFWEEWPGKEPPHFFATYFYHANAGAFLNLVLPVTLGLAARSVIARESPPVRTLWLCAALMVALGAAANTSRAGWGIGALLLLALVAMAIRRGRTMIRQLDWRSAAIACGIVAVALFAVAQASHLHKPLERLANTRMELSGDARWEAARAGFAALPDAGWFGFGPGTFRTVFPHYVERSRGRLVGTWRFLHQDYIQTVLEWGFVGGLLLGALFFGGILAGLLAWRRNRMNWRLRQRMLLPLAMLALGSVALHALVDFPLQIASIELYVATYLGICWGSWGWGEVNGER